MAICNAHRNWFRLKCPYPYGSKEYSRAYAKLDNATYRDIEKLKKQFDKYEDGSCKVTHYQIYDAWFCRVEGLPAATKEQLNPPITYVDTE